LNDSTLPHAASVAPPRCAFIGDESLVAQCADIARRAGLEVVVIATRNGQVRDYAHDNDIPVVDSGGDLPELFAAHRFDVLLSVANLRVLPEALLDQATTNINFHDGPLPGYGGLNATTWAILGDEPQHEITWHIMTADVDGGEIITTETFPILPDDTAFSLNARAYEAALRSFPRVAEQLAARSLSTTPQPGGTRRMFGKFQRPAAVFDPRTPAAATERTVRALDLGHRYRNTLGVVRIVFGDHVYVLEKVRVLEPTPGVAPGHLVAIDDDGVRLATGDGDLLLVEISEPDGRPADVRHAFTSRGLGVGSALEVPSDALVTELEERDGALARSETFWLDRLAGLEPSDLPRLSSSGPAVWAEAPIAVPTGADADEVFAAAAGWLARLSGHGRAAVAYDDAATRAAAESLAPLVHRPVAVVDVPDQISFADLRERAAAERTTLAKRGPFLLDLLGRDVRTREHQPVLPVVVCVGDATSADGVGDASIARIEIAEDGSRATLRHRTDAIDAAHAVRLAEQIATFLAAGHAAPQTPVGELPLIGATEAAALAAINDTALDYDRDATIDALFRAQAARTPDAAALSFGSRTLTYAELLAATHRMAAALRGVGVGRGDRVGIALPRGIDMVVGVLATLDCGAAYVPLDPTYPEDRLEFMVDDAGIKALLAEGETATTLSRPGLAVVDPAVADATPTSVNDAPPVHDARDLAYVIYTSGSTGRPKGVMLEHRNAVNFFAAMDEHIEHEQPGVWLSVTSLSFDISVLELLWTLTRGFHVVLKADRGIPAAKPTASASSAVAKGTRPVTFSLFYFAAGESEASEGYRLLLEGAKFADANGFEAVWTPERHFHAFGGHYPNPSVVSAAVAATTTHVHIRAGSVVAPLHSPVRIAEEWAIVDNLSNGRVAISFAAGWQPNDFVLNPAVYGRAKSELPGLIDRVKRLWRGETVEMPGHDGEPVGVRTLPRPVQPELPVWLTSAGTPATFEQAGTLGTNILTHLLGQSVEELGANIARYRAAWKAAGHPGEGRVTLMLHTFLDRDGARAKEAAREPLKGYLGTAASLLKNMASAFPTFANAGKDMDEAFRSLTDDEMSQLLDMAASRYLDTSGLFGTPQQAADMVETVSALGVDEVACLIDFGVETQQVIDSFGLLLETKALVDEPRKAAPTAAAGASAPVMPAAPRTEQIAVEDDTVAALTSKHRVTHLQCTPSLAAMLVADPSDRQALTTIDHLMVGGEALPTALAGELRKLLPHRFTNMYGPTETTIWSLVHEIRSVPEGPVPIGLPIGNTTIHVLDANGRPLPAGAFGELHIGGDGVARGYHARPELTAERFVERPGIGRVYATGDVARIHPDGYVEFAGRADNQVKIRGHRIELGEIESALDAHPDVVQSVVVARSPGGGAAASAESGSPQLVAYVVTHGNRALDSDILRKHVAETLPEIMVPAIVVGLDSFPLTPNGKVDRKALPAPPAGLTSAVADASVVPPADDREKVVADIWTEELGRPVGRDDNFFEIGGHSLLAVKVFRRLSEAVSVPLALTDIFRYPTVRTFAAHLAASEGTSAGAATAAPNAPTGSDRGAMRRRAMARRGGTE
jgi:natural product biosynthesis luciferase-like monooxygenase protein